MKGVAAAFVAFLSASALFASVAPLGEATSPGQLIVHEWGMFTSVAGEDGRPVRWLPLSGPTDLPCFVERAPGIESKGALFATVRMETPVLYFYSPVETAVDVDVRFPQGLITEYFPPARIDGGSIAWSRVRVRPDGSVDFPVEEAPSHYYAARATNAAPLQLDEHTERFLFYRGVGSFPLPLAATVGEEDTAVTVINLGRDRIDSVVLFENRGGRIGYRSIDMLDGTAGSPLPTLDGDLRSLRVHLERMLTRHGLYPAEAAAMFDTWSDSWFEEGARLFYIVPDRAIASIVPLHIEPRPAETVRVFVGRLELMTPAALDDAAKALVSLDRPALERYGRFLQPIAVRLLATPMPLQQRVLMQQRIDALIRPAAPALDRCGRPGAPAGTTQPSRPGR